MRNGDWANMLRSDLKSELIRIAAMVTLRAEQPAGGSAYPSVEVVNDKGPPVHAGGPVTF